MCGQGGPLPPFTVAKLNGHSDREARRHQTPVAGSLMSSKPPLTMKGHQAVLGRQLPLAW
jgi:hypothetical protein